MIDNNQDKSSSLYICLGIGLILVSIAFMVYYLLNSVPIIEYKPIKLQIILPKPEEKNWRLIISVIRVESPIIINVNGENESQYLEYLQKGVAHLSGTALPGNSGNIFIFGHSSYYFFAPGDYKYIFHNLDKLNNGDEITIESNLNIYKYKVIDKKIVDPSDIEITKEIIKDKETLTLMTCTPTGTSLKRLIVIAERI